MRTVRRIVIAHQWTRVADNDLSLVRRLLLQRRALPALRKAGGISLQTTDGCLRRCKFSPVHAPKVELISYYETDRYSRREPFYYILVWVEHLHRVIYNCTESTAGE